MKTTTPALRRSPSGVLATTALGGAVTAALLVPSATAAKDPCTASEVARTVGSVITSTGDYLDSHPETNQVLTSVLQQPPSPQSIATLNTYFEANPKVKSDIQTVTEPLTDLTTKCRLAVSLPQLLGLLQAVQAQGALPGGPGTAPPTLLR
ncbi:MAG TPA: hemophore [Mycobacterium sp.]|nr:hemophore [Mycobacterium sp.]